MLISSAGNKYHFLCQSINRQKIHCCQLRVRNISANVLQLLINCFTQFGVLHSYPWHHLNYNNGHIINSKHTEILQMTGYNSKPLHCCLIQQNHYCILIFCLSLSVSHFGSAHSECVKNMFSFCSPHISN